MRGCCACCSLRCLRTTCVTLVYSVTCIGIVPCVMGFPWPGLHHICPESMFLEIQLEIWHCFRFVDARNFRGNEVFWKLHHKWFPPEILPTVVLLARCVLVPLWHCSAGAPPVHVLAYVPQACRTHTYSKWHRVAAVCVWWWAAAAAACVCVCVVWGTVRPPRALAAACHAEVI